MHKKKPKQQQKKNPKEMVKKELTAQATQRRPLQTAYLALYNLALLVVWGYLLFQIFSHFIRRGHRSQVYDKVHVLALWSQAVTTVEVFHVMLGLSHDALLPLVVESVFRFAVLIGAAECCGSAVTNTPTYPMMLEAWSIAAGIHYSYALYRCLLGAPPRILRWAATGFYLLFFALSLYGEGMCWHHAAKYLGASQDSVLGLNPYSFAIWGGVLMTGFPFRCWLALVAAVQSSSSPSSRSGTPTTPKHKLSTDDISK